MPTSTPLQPTITSAGLAAIYNAQNTGVEFAISHIAFGTGQYVPDGSETALHTEKLRVPIAGGGRISPTQIQVYAIAMATLGNPFFVGEVGFFGDNGATLLAVYSSTGTPGLFLSDTVSTSVSYALGLAALPANSVTVTIDPSASAALLLLGNHVTAPDPHPQYVEKVNGVAFYDPTLTFNLDAQIIGDDGLVYQSAQANNTGNTPSSSPTWWVPLYNYGDTPVAGLANANVTLSSTQAARAHITFSGALTAALNIVFPNWVKDWTVVNNTTGAFALTCKTAAGTGVAIPQNGSPTKIRGDGTNITQAAENIAPATAPQHALQLGQAVGRLLNIQVITSSGPYTPTPGTNSIVVEAAAPGGGSGGTPATGSTASSASAPGAAGTYAKARFTSGFAGATVTMGAPGAAGTNTPGAGGTGGTSSFVGTGISMSLPGGTGGVAGGAVTSSAIAAPTLGPAAATITGAAQIMANVPGAPGAFGLINAPASSNVAGGNGGGNPLGTPGVGGYSNIVGATAGTGYGAGAGGQTAGVSNAAKAGLAGAPGVFIVWEFA